MPEARLELGEFKFLVPVAKAVEEGGELYVEGVASSTAVDHEGEVISAKGQASMAQWANAGAVVLGGEADHFRVGFDDDLGIVEKGEVYEDGKFLIRAHLDKDNPRAVYLHKKMCAADGPKLGLSVFGRITEHHKSEDGRPVIDGVALKRVMVTSRPVNPDTWLTAVAKSLDADREPEPEPETEADPVQLAKGAFLDALKADEERKQKQAPVTAQRERFEEIGRLYHVLYDVLDRLTYVGEISAEQRAVAMDEAIREFQREVLAKSEGDGTLVAGGSVTIDGGLNIRTETDPSQPETAAPTEPETEAAPPAPAENPNLPADYLRKLEAAAESHASTETEAPAAPNHSSLGAEQAPVPEPEASHPAVRIAKSFKEAAALLFAEETDPAAQRTAMQSLVSATAQALDKALPVTEEQPPAWAQALLAKVDSLEARLAAPTDAPAATAKARSEAESVDKPAVDVDKLRKSAPPDIRPSANVAKAQTFHNIVDQLFAAGAYPD